MRNLPTIFRLARIPFVGRFVSRGTSVGDPNNKAWIVPIHEQVGVPDSLHLPLDILQPLIEKASYIAKAKECICRAAWECKDHPHDIACLFFGNAFEHAEENGLAMLSPEEAIQHVERAVRAGLVPTILWEKEIETIWGAPRETGLAVCLCCDCCCEYRLGLRLGGPRFRKKVFRPEGVSVIVSDDCDLLGDCASPDVCSVNAITLGPIKAQIDLEKCVGCGHCVQVCPIEAISFELDPEVDFVGDLLSKVESVTDIT